MERVVGFVGQIIDGLCVSDPILTFTTAAASCEDINTIVSRHSLHLSLKRAVRINLGRGIASTINPWFKSILYNYYNIELYTKSIVT